MLARRPLNAVHALACHSPAVAAARSPRALASQLPAATLASAHSSDAAAVGPPITGRCPSRGRRAEPPCCVRLDVLPRSPAQPCSLANAARPTRWSHLPRSLVLPRLRAGRRARSLTCQFAGAVCCLSRQKLRALARRQPQRSLAPPSLPVVVVRVRPLVATCARSLADRPRRRAHTPPVLHMRSPTGSSPVMPSS